MKNFYFLSLTLLLSIFSFGQATDLIISEYAEGTISNSKYVEIFNGTGADVDLAGYRIWTIANGGAWPETSINLSGILAKNATYVIANNATDVPGANLYNTNCNWNGDDAVGLAKDIAAVWTLIDAVGTDGLDPGSGWNVAGITNGTVNNKLTRKGTVCSPNTNWVTSAGTDAANSEWVVAAYTTGAAAIGHANSCTTDPALYITNPINGTVFNPNTTNVNIELLINSFVVANGTGDGHIHYTLNGGSPIMKYDITPISIPVTAGNTYTVFVELVNNSHNSISPAVNATVTFQVAALNVVADLAALRADVLANGVGKYYQVSSTPVISYARTTRNQKYIQDATAGILIDDLPGTISTAMVAGDAISGLKGQSALFSGVLQLLPLENATVASSGNTITPQVVTAANIAASIETYESELVQINNASFTTANGTIVFVTNTNYNLNDGSDITFRAIFSEANYIGTIVPSGAANRVVLVAEFNGTPQVVSRSLADTNLSVNQNKIAGLNMYPNPVKNGNLYITSNSSNAKTVAVYDILGKQVVNTKTTNNAVNVSNLKGGAYIVKITEDGKTDTKKLIIE